MSQIDLFKEDVDPIHLDRKDNKMTSKVDTDQFTDKVEKAFDYEFEGQSSFRPIQKPEAIPENFDIGLIVGSSGSGKSTLLSDFGGEQSVKWRNDKAIVSHFESPQNAIDYLSGVGLNSIPTWCKPYNVLSTGEKFRAGIARKLEQNVDVIDEFTSVVDRQTAKAASVALRKLFARRDDLSNLVLAGCHKDVVRWLQPDWVIDTDQKMLYFKGQYLQQPQVEVNIFRCSYEAWAMFADHHYLDKSINKAARCFLATWNGEPVGFSSALSMPNPYIESAWREHRTVVLPDYQGMGIGSRLSNTTAEIFLEDGNRYFSRTAHPKFGEYRERSDKWEATSKNQVKRTDVDNDDTFKDWVVDNERICYSHEYVGE